MSEKWQEITKTLLTLHISGLPICRKKMAEKFCCRIPFLMLFRRRRRGSKMQKVPSFFKYFIAEWNHLDMQIPKSFTSSLKEVLPEKVFLRDRRNRVWPVKVAKAGDSWNFIDGWDKFVEDNSLVTSDLMVFEYISDRLFNVKLYGPDSTEKNPVGPSGPVENRGQVSASANVVPADNDVGPSRPAERRGQASAEADIVLIDDDDDETVSCQHCSNDVDVDEGNEDGETVAMTGHTENEHEEDGAVGDGDNRPLRYLFSRCYGMKVFEDGLAQQPTNPYFVARVLPRRVADLFVPIDVLKDYDIQLGKQITLVDPSGSEFVSKCRVWSDGRTIISGGWKRLCRVNSVALEDLCICEFVKRGGDRRQFLRISFVRGAAGVIYNDL